MPNLVKFANNAHSTLLSNLGPTDTVLTVPNGEGARFPNPSGGDFFMLTIEDTSGNIEIVDCTGRTTDVLTVIRGREGTTARAYTVGATLEMRVTADMLEYLDWRAVANQNNGSVQLDGAGKLLTTVLDTPLNTLGDVRFQAKLGFTPVTQGGGTGMGVNRMYLGPNALDATKILVQVDNNAPVELVKRVGSVVSFGGPQAAITNGAVEDDLAMGTNGAYLYSNAIAWGWFHPVQGSLMSLTTATGNVQFKGDVFGATGRLRYASEAITIAQVTSLQPSLDDKVSKTVAGTQAIASNITMATGTLSAAAVVDTSDRTYKTDIKTMAPEDAIAIVRGMRSVRFFNKLTNKWEFGYVAQELQGEGDQLGKGPAPEMITTNTGGDLAVAYQRAVAPLTVVAQNLLTRVEVLEAKLQAST